MMNEPDEREKKSDVFYFTGIPNFDKKAWEKISENLEGFVVYDELFDLDLNSGVPHGR